MTQSAGEGRLTLPIQTGMDDEIRALVERLKPDAVRNSDGTELPEIARELVDKVYATYFPSRGDHEWSRANPDHRVHQYLMTDRVTAFSSEPLQINVLDGYFAQQFAPELKCDLGKYWQVIDRTTGETIPYGEWSVESAPAVIDKENEVKDSGPRDEEAESAIVTIHHPEEFHVYTVNFLARQIWDSTQIYNYLTNNWAANPDKLKDKTYDPAYAETWAHMQEALDKWLVEHPEVDVVRFTTFFYHFTLVFNERALEKYADWFGYSAAVSVPAMEAFEAEYGYALTPEDFVDAGYYNSTFRPPAPRFQDWIDFTSRSVAEKAKVLVDKVHDAGREAIMFLGDNWIGTEPYGKYFPEIGLDAVVGSVGNACTCRMISDIPGVKYTEGRFLPYFFPDVFRPGGDPVGEANKSWATGRRAIIRKPLDRMGYGGYLSLALEHPDFVDRVEEIVAEFRSIHDKTGGELPQNSSIKVGIVNAWGKLRTWQTHMVSHALWFKEIWAYQGVIEALAGLPFEVEFLSFDEIRDGVPEDIAVLINAGSAGTAFSGGEVWEDAALQGAVRAFVARGGGLIGVGEPTALDHSVSTVTGNAFALADVFGVDQERDLSLSTDRYPVITKEHFVTADLPKLEGELWDGQTVRVTEGRFGADFVPEESVAGVYSAAKGTIELARDRGGVTLAAHEYGQGRAVYASGLAYSIQNSRLLHRAIYWAAGKEDEFAENWICDNPAIEVAYYPQSGLLLAANCDEIEAAGV
ncbi:MAG: 1,3-beta-galactosyl-N-acetylhexosamine phosphorylase, partial [Arcanobacterium sp.]|nr:1,3-beta-galactosyl-N-acetylhexosamine phosphorylase [Arcanobacterium sp.]